MAHEVLDPPARALQPEPPARYSRSLAERLGLQRWLSSVERMIVRHLERQPLRAVLSCLGIAISIAILVLGNFGTDTIDVVMDFQFQPAQRQDVTVTFVEPSVGRVLHDLQHLPGVQYVEVFGPFRCG